MIKQWCRNCGNSEFLTYLADINFSYWCSFCKVKTDYTYYQSKQGDDIRLKRIAFAEHYRTNGITHE